MSENVFTRIEPELKAALEELGELDERSLSYMVRRAIIELLRANDKLPSTIAEPIPAKRITKVGR